MRGLFHNWEVIELCNQMGDPVTGYDRSRILEFTMEKIVYLRFAGIFDAEGNDIYEGPHEVTSHGRHSRICIMRYHRYLGTPQQLEEDELSGIVFIQMSTEQEVMLPLESHHSGEGQLRWDTGWGTFPTHPIYPSATPELPNVRDPRITEMLLQGHATHN